MRDSQRSALYRAEDEVDAGRRLASIDDVQAYVDRILGSSYWERLTGAPRTVVVRDGRGRRHACAGQTWFGAELRLPRWSRSELVVLHELAHTVTPETCAGHGREFAANYLRLVRRYLSFDHGDALAKAFERHGVVFEQEVGS